METTNLPTVLLVDDERQVLDGLSIHLRRRCTVLTATSGAQGLATLAANPATAVIVSDMRMPGMDGAAFLAAARTAAPTAVRILLTGHADMNSAIAAVNEGQIFRFLTKPCSPKVLQETIEAAATQNRLITAEKVLLEQTLRGSLRMMTEILAHANPTLFGRATRLQHTIAALADKLGQPNHWQIDVAVMLAQLAEISLPPETAEKLSRNQELSVAEKAMVARLPATTDQLLAHIPRLETVRVMIAKSLEPYRAIDCQPPAADAALIDMGVPLIKAAMAYDALCRGGFSEADAVTAMRSQPQRFDESVLRAMVELYANPEDKRQIVAVPLSGLKPGMVLAEDLVTVAGVLLVARGFAVTPMFLERIGNYATATLQKAVRVVQEAEPA